MRRGRGAAPRIFFFLLCELRVLCVLCVKSAPLNAQPKNAPAPLSIPSPVLQAHVCPARPSCAFPRHARSMKTSPLPPPHSPPHPPPPSPTPPPPTTSTN